MYKTSPHNFHIPVMGLSFTIDSPIKVARYGINSAISIIEDNLMEMMRKYYCKELNEPYIPIETSEEDFRERRITAYLNLLNKTVQRQIEKIKSSAFEAGSELAKYFETLPENHLLKEKYHQLYQLQDQKEKEKLQHLLRDEVRAGAIEVNLMSKVDKDNYGKDGKAIADGSDALKALKGYAESTLENSAIIFSAGMNPRLFNYLENFSDFKASTWNTFKKRIVIKVNDYRSALIQGKYLAKKGIWVSEFRIESGLNCGGHAFATQGNLLGPILEEFKQKREELASELFQVYNSALQRMGEAGFKKPHQLKITVQGGIGTSEENNFLLNYYKVDRTGWGTPFLLCPEATTVDEDTLQKLLGADKEDVVLSRSSPLGVRFNYLKGTTSEKERLERIENNMPGSPCPEKHLLSNTEFTEKPICTASRKYQKLKLAQLKAAEISEEERKQQINEVLEKECLCIGLCNSAALVYNTPFLKNLHAVTVCPGPNIINFNKTVTLKQMTDHIYGRSDVIVKQDRPHMFIKELQLYLEHLSEQLASYTTLDVKTSRNLKVFADNLFDGIAYYRTLFVTEGMMTIPIEMVIIEAEKELLFMKESIEAMDLEKVFS